MEWILLVILFIIIIDYYSYVKMENFDDAVSTSTTNVTENNTTQPREPVVVTNESPALGWMSIFCSIICFPFFVICCFGCYALVSSRTQK